MIVLIILFISNCDFYFSFQNFLYLNTDSCPCFMNPTIKDGLELEVNYEVAITD